MLAIPEMELKHSLQRAQGECNIEFVHQVGEPTASKLSKLYQAGCLKALLPKTYDAVPHAVIINTAGGVTAGDKLRLQIKLHAGAKAKLATQTAERLYRGGDFIEGDGRIEVAIQLDESAFMHWLPQETMVFDASRSVRTTRVDMAASAGILMTESFVFGREAMGENINHLRLRDRREIWVDGKIRLHDQLLIESAERLRQSYALDGASFIAVSAMVWPDAVDKLSSAQQVVESQNARSAAKGWVSVVNDCLIVRSQASSAFLGKRWLRGFLELFTGEQLPRVWRM